MWFPFFEEAVSCAGESTIFVGSESTFAVSVELSRSVYLRGGGGPEKSREWAPRLPENQGERCGGTALQAARALGPKREVTSDKKVRKEVHEKQGGAVSEVGAGAERCWY